MTFKPGDLAIITSPYRHNQLMVVDHKEGLSQYFKARFIYPKKGVSTSLTRFNSSVITKLYGKGLTQW